MATNAPSDSTGNKRSPREKTVDIVEPAAPDRPETASAGPGGQSAGPAGDYIRDIKLMLEYCRRRGIPIPEKIESEIELVYGAAPPGGSLRPLVRLHGQLSQLVAPATPCSLAATTFSFKDKEARGTTLFIVGMLTAAVLGIIGYLFTLSPGAPADATDGPTDVAYFAAGLSGAGVPAAHQAVLVARSTGSVVSGEQIRQCANYLFAAVVGSAFYSLLTAYGYLRRRTFDPSYLTTYIIRFILGVLAGVVLASFGSELIGDDDVLSKLGPGILALLGGYSAEAVRLILDRFVEVLVTTVKGHDGFDERRVAVAGDVLAILQAASDNAGTPAEVKERLDALLKKLQQ